MLGRDDESELLESLLRHAAEGRGGGVILHGEPGIGKTALLAHASEQAAGFRVLRAVGVEPEADLAYATLHQLLLPVLGRVHELPDPQARALRVLFGRAHGAPPDPFMVGLSTLSLLSLAAGERPVLCVVDDAHWADRPTLKTLAFVARRLDDEPVAVVLAARADEGHSTDLPDLRRIRLAGLRPEAARALLAGRAGEPRLSEGAQDRLLAVTGGNPLALLELAGTTIPPEGTHEPPAMTDRLRRSFLARIRARHVESLPLLQLIAADGSGSVETIDKAAASMGIATDVLHRAELDDVLTHDGTRLVFRHPLIRSAIYHSATANRRVAIHRALAAAFDAPADQHRHAWHLGQAAVGHDEHAADQLEHSAEQAALRGGPAAAMASLSRAAELTVDGPRRGRRLWSAAHAAAQGGFTAAAAELLDRAEREPSLDETDRISVAVMRAVVAEFAGSPVDAMDLIKPWLPRALRIDRRRFTPTAAMYGNLGVRANRPQAWSDLAEWLDGSTLAPDDPQDAVLLLLRDAGRARTGRDPGAAVRDRAAVESLTDPITMTLAGSIARELGDRELSGRLYRNAGKLARNSGALGALAWNLGYQAADEISRGRLGLAEAHAEEGCQFAAEVGQPNTGCRNRGLLALCAAIRGRADAGELAAGVLAEASGRDLADAVFHARRALGLIELVAGRHREAVRHFEAAGGRDAGAPPDLGMGIVPDLVEALVRAGERDRAAAATARYAQWTERIASPELGALTARCRALVRADGGADVHYAESLRLHARCDAPLEQARTELLFGERLRRDRRRSEAQEHLRAAAETFRRIGALPWAERALEELRATGESARTRAPEADTLSTLTPQELRITLAVAEGATNREIAAQLFLSPRTVDYHLRKVFQKAGITSRAELIRLVLAERSA
ncbi:LuxR family transcriptional regulator [Nonomuraea angiospora]|uniref:LuxR family transcriptional regulator n=1 Tax=Nonomuraea angiospora TaxID=46172 RepID=UPI0029B1B8F3|nr:LuxR family transcriptional regulator [Nonomuraea angiospora]MDX3103252.1 LuxR family transcriptional regulator [Nonomuraea angiospora]